MTIERRRPEGSDSKGIIYCLTNPAIPDMVKIGSTTNIAERIKQHDATNIPLPFECELALEVEDHVRAERWLHEAFGDRRVRTNRELFRVSPQRVIAAMRLTGGVDVTPEADDDNPDAVKARDTARRIRAAFNFRMVDIEPGTEIYFRANAPDDVDDEQITATVRSHNRIEFEGEITSLSAAATAIMRRRGFTAKGGYGGPYYWYLDGESMWERRMRMEREGMQDFDPADFDPRDFG
ncbi:MAG: GIY-YIG nuclease family protein [Chloroflexi bacterium]|nr:GIY-YIG nuclease family protein [Chloroflexota bacterium]